METTSRNEYKYSMPSTRSIRSPSPKAVPGIDNENSPLQIACTQEYSDSIDVVWDWNSPQGKKHPRKCQKRILQSSKIPLRKYPSMQDFEKLRKELQSLNELALPDREENISSVGKSDYKSLTGIISIEAPIQELNDEEFDELMDDDINEKLFAISQQVGDQLKTTDMKENGEDLKTIGIKKNGAEVLKTNFTNENMGKSKTSDTKNIEETCEDSDSKENVYNIKKNPVANNKLQFKSIREKALANDSFDDLLRCVDVDQLTGYSSKEECIKNDKYLYTSTQQIETNSGKVEFHRTRSFEISNSISQITRKCTQEQIEQKRKEALAKLESKKKLDRAIVCSQQEIEKKRLQALAKIESKRQQEIIERKRQEALRRLEMKRQKNAIMVKSSLVTRLK